MNRQLTSGEFSSLPTGSVVRELMKTDVCPVHGVEESGYNDYLRQDDGTWLIINVDEPERENFEFLAAMSVITPVSSAELGRNDDDGVSYSWELLEKSSTLTD